MQKNLTNLSQEMVANGYTVKDLQPDGIYHRFPLSGGGKGSPSYYLLQKTAVGYRATYGDFVSGRKYFWTSDNGKPISPKETEKLKAELADEAKEFGANSNAGMKKALWRQVFSRRQAMMRIATHI